ncbi:MAG: ketoacyl-ACP synthase III [Bacteroidales bacterium]|nr:ketoacyl-ACP synthase III [Bacteroidales bacterium]MDD4210316.1 ketoacyl-ACP synthase III [Bacteroidales bacterium]
MRIIGTGSALPSLIVTNDMLAEFLDTSDEWITSRTGVKTRRIISTEYLKDLAIQAAKIALDEAKLKLSDIDFLLCSNLVNSYVTPSLSSIIQGDLGTTCPCVDFNAACAGFVYALDVSDAMLKTNRAKNILIICAEEPSRIVDWAQRDASVLFGDGAAAVVVSNGKDDLKAVHLSTTSNPGALFYRRKLEYNPFVKKEEETAPLIMNGQEVFRFAVTGSMSDIRYIFEKTGLTGDDIKYFVCHQANIRIIDAIRQQVNQPEEKFPHNLEYYGNTASASIPILLDELNKQNKLKEGDLLLMTAFGAGITTGACLLSWSEIKK